MIQIQPIYKPLYTNKNKFIIILSGGRGSAKSFNAATFIQRLSFERGHKILFSRYTMTSANISVIPEFTDKIQREGTEEYFVINKNEIKNTFSGSVILFRGIKTSSGNQTANLKSIQGITGFVGDEMEEWKSEEDFEKLLLSLRTKGTQLRVILILNPTDDSHFIYRKYIEKTHKIVTIDGVNVQISTHPDVLHIHSTYLDNLENLDAQFLNMVRRIKEQAIEKATVNGVFTPEIFNQTKYAHTIIGKWADVPMGAIFQNWEIGDFDYSLPYCYGQDYGFSVDPDTLIMVAINEKKKLIYIDEKYYARQQLSTDELYKINIANVRKPHDLIIGDSAEPRLINELKKRGLNIRATRKAPNSVVNSIMKMLDYKLIVTENSHNVIKELKNYTWNDKRAGIPKDAYNHAIDAIRYAFQELQPNTNDLQNLSTFI